jgi:hypothetical protein
MSRQHPRVPCMGCGVDLREIRGFPVVLRHGMVCQRCADKEGAGYAYAVNGPIQREAHPLNRSPALEVQPFPDPGSIWDYDPNEPIVLPDRIVYRLGTVVVGGCWRFYWYTECLPMPHIHDVVLIATGAHGPLRPMED